MKSWLLGEDCTVLRHGYDKNGRFGSVQIWCGAAQRVMGIRVFIEKAHCPLCY